MSTCLTVTTQSRARQRSMVIPGAARPVTPGTCSGATIQDGAQSRVMKDWVAWHEAYDDPTSPLSTRLRVVRGHLSDALDAAPPGPVRLVSLCAGQGHDVLGVLPAHPRGPQVSAVLVEYDPQNAALARQGAGQAGLPRVEVRQADAAQVANYADALPADVLLLCGIFGNVSDEDIQRTAEAAPGTVRARGHRDLDQAPAGAGPDAADPRLVPGQRVRRGRLRRAGRDGHRCQRRRRPPGGGAAGRAADGPLFTFRAA